MEKGWGEELILRWIPSNGHQPVTAGRREDRKEGWHLTGRERRTGQGRCGGKYCKRNGKGKNGQKGKGWEVRNMEMGMVETGWTKKKNVNGTGREGRRGCLLYTSPSPRDS